MKKLLLLSLVFAFAMVSVNAQQFLRTYANDTVKADTNYYPSSNSDPNTLSPSYGVKSTISTGVVSFTFTHTDVADSLAFAGIEGSNNASNWYTVSTVAATSTDGESVVSTSTPLTYLYYRARLSAASGDTVAITNARIIYKEK